MDEMEKFKQTFITECYELLTEMESLLLNLNETSYTSEELNAIFRCAHSIKGGAGAFGLQRLTSFTHVLENILDALRMGKMQPKQDLVDLLLKSVDILTNLVSAAEKNTSLADDYGDELLKALEGVREVSSPTHKSAHEKKVTSEQTSTKSIYNIQFTPNESMLKSGNEPLLIIRELQKLGPLETNVNISKLPLLENIEPLSCYINWNFKLETAATIDAIKEVFEFVELECALEIQKQEQVIESPAIITQAKDKSESNKPREETTKNSEHSNHQSSSVRVDIEKIDRLVNMVGELVITQSMLYSMVKHLPMGQFTELVRGIDDLSQHTRDLQEAVMAVRMQPVKTIFSRMPRIVRDIAAQLGKNIKIETYGENTELDKTVIEQLSDPLTHMIRNSADHGIEHPEERVKNGKLPQGVIKLSASHRGGRIIIEIADDGAGIKRDKVLKKAKEQNIVPANAVLTDEEIDSLIMLPGFSTADQISNISGRGVGMDVVKKNIESLGGTIEIKNTPTKGSNFTVSLPLTLAILDGMIVRVGEESYIIPISSIIETLKPKAQDVKQLAEGGSVINVRGEYISVLYLSELFNIKGSEQEISNSLILLVENGRNKYGLIVDELLGQQQVVIKSLEANSDPVEGVSGATILGNGKVSLILDVAKLQAITASKRNAKFLKEKIHA